MADRGLERRLQDFGFSEKEAAVYRSLLHLGEAKPSKIASAANVSTRYVYAVGERLASRGFVTVNDHVTPTVMRALPPEEVVEKLRTELADLETNLRQQYDELEQVEMGVEVIKTSMTLRKRLRTHIDRATESVALSIPGVALSDIEAELREARDRGVIVQLVLDRSGDTPEVAGVADLARTSPPRSLAMACVDGMSGMVMSSDMLERSNSGDQALLCRDQRIGQLFFGGFMGTIWLISNEHFVREPAALPERYSSLRRAIIDAALHRRNEIDLCAEIIPTTDGTSEQTAVSGTVVEVRQPFIDPTTAALPTDAALLLDTGEERIEIADGIGHVEHDTPAEIRLHPA